VEADVQIIVKDAIQLVLTPQQLLGALRAVALAANNVAELVLNDAMDVLMYVILIVHLDAKAVVKVVVKPVVVAVTVVLEDVQILLEQVIIP
jgi:hypothetical protein